MITTTKYISELSAIETDIKNVATKEQADCLEVFYGKDWAEKLAREKWCNEDHGEAYHFEKYEPLKGYEEMRERVKLAWYDILAEIGDKKYIK